jgi:hypothetical protein
MTALRMTRSVLTTPRLRAAAIALVVACGCGGPPGPVDDPRPTLTPLPQPTAERIGYDPETGVLRLYDLPASARWTVELPTDPVPVAVGPSHVLPKHAPPAKTYIAYQRPSGQKSVKVSLADVLAARTTNPSNLP